MGRKSRMKRDKNRHKAFIRLREMGSDTLKLVTLKNGVEVYLNPLKHFLLDKPYKRDEYINEALRSVGELALGRETMDKLQNAETHKVSATTSLEVND